MKGTLHETLDNGHKRWVVHYTLDEDKPKQHRVMPVDNESYALAYKLDWVAKSYNKADVEVEFEVIMSDKPDHGKWRDSHKAKLIEKKMVTQSEIKEYPEIDKTYKHYKGGKYVVITMAKHSETNEDLVIYKSLHFGSYHARPLSMWADRITLSKDNESFNSVLRFALCS